MSLQGQIHEFYFKRRLGAQVKHGLQRDVRIGRHTRSMSPYQSILIWGRYLNLSANCSTSLSTVRSSKGSAMLHIYACIPTRVVSTSYI
jgi:hypothetical protein